MTDFPFDAVLFDCDGVLVDSEPITNRVLAQMLNEMGWAITVHECMDIFIGKAVKDERDLIEKRTGVRIDDAWLHGFRLRRNEALDRDLVEIAGASQTVRTLHTTLEGRIAVASGADLRKVELQLAKVGMVDCFTDRIFSGQDLPRSKPFPDVYLAASSALGVEPDRCAVIEDTATGTQAGVAAGATVFAYSPPHAGPKNLDALHAAGATHIFTDMTELPALLAQWR